ncbi:protein of unknown function [Taphrina deformans PYCC 5710]|uniref:Ras-GAP domain-containing protein n=1 Tax=Taphrina deformans (strain PYCC 5710 / ATCC 11124 / CBS 356.35 / IMI 108563 / JCM 9778 / NBRC 8474) TaxID=1097556 RepID=R4XDL0_TAPDE|nr:protein of unknown function [Taphrina deformans PYCC 5710]|eukprot:CCG83925.1 protein of unknown function [Taphrina deformans PYCC 5710]
MPYILTVVQRLVDALPVNSKRSLQYIATDEVLQRCSAIIFEIAIYELRDVVSELVAALGQLVKSSSRQESCLDSQIYLMRIITQCIDRVAHDEAVAVHYQRLDHAAVSRVLTLYIKMASITNHDLDSLLNDPGVSARPVKLPRPTSQLIARMTSESSIDTSPSHHEEFLRHFGHMIRFTSKTNWPATFEVIRSLLKHPYSEDEEVDYNKKIQLLSYLELDCSVVDSLLVVCFNSLNSMLKSTQSVCIAALSKALARWITSCPQQIRDFRGQAQTYLWDGGLHLEDLLYTLVEGSSSKRRANIWPVLAILMVLYPVTLCDSKEQRQAKRDSFIQTLKTAINSKMSGTCLDAYTYILCMVSHLPMTDQISWAPLVSAALTSISSSVGVLRNCVEKGTFKLVTQLFCAFFRLDIPQSLELAMWKLDLWLDERETSLLKIKAVQCVAAIFADNSQPAKSKGREKLLQVASGRIKIPFLGKSVLENDAVENDISQYVLDMFCTAPEVILADQDHSHALDAALVSCLAQTILNSHTTAGQLILELQSPHGMQGRIFERTLHNDSQSFFPIWCRFSVESIRGIIKRLSTLEPADIEHIVDLLDLLSQCLSQRLLTLHQYADRIGMEKDVQGHLKVKESLEVILLQYSCHVNVGIATRAAEACKLLVAEINAYSRYTTAAASGEPDNIELYNSMAGETFLTAGRNAVQKKFRNSLRSARDTPALRNAWLAVFARWSKLTDQLFDSRNAMVRGQEAQIEWQNYTGFLAAVARIEKADHEDPVYTFISRFREVFIQSHTEFMSEICAEIIGNALHLSLYTPMLQGVQQMIATMKDRTGVLIVRSRSTILMEQLILICRGLFERLDSFLAFREGVNVGEIMLDLAQYLELCGQTYIRSRLRFCNLCETFATRYDLMCILDEVSVRRRLCNYLGSWIALSAASNKDLAKITRDTNAACLKALTQLSRDMYFGHERMSVGRQVAWDMKSFVQLVLPLSSMTEVEATRFTSAPLRPALIMLLSNVLAANRRIATTTFISLCYHENINVAATFTLTLGNCLDLEAGVVKSPTTAELENRLWALVTQDASIATALLDGSSTADGPLELVLSSFQSQSCTPRLFALVLDVEVAICDQETELFRRNSPTTRLFAAYIRRCGRQYVAETLQSPLDHLTGQPEDYSMELDASKLQNTESANETLQISLQHNQANLISTCQEFIDAICGSLSKLPDELREILRLVGVKTAEKYPDAVPRSVGSFLILRLIGPAIVQSSKGSPRLQRQLILVVKILTNLANDTFFKEGHLVTLNEFLRENSSKLSNLLRSISQPNSGSYTVLSDGCAVLTGEKGHQLHPFFQQKPDRIKNKLIEIQLKQGYTVDSIREKTQTIRQILCSLGEPTRSDKLDDQQSSSLSSSAFLNSPVPELKQVFRQIGLTLTQKPVYYIDVPRFGAFHAATWLSLCSDIWQTMLTMPINSMEIFLDVTGFSMLAFADSQAAQNCVADLLTQDASKRAVLHVYNANNAYTTFLRQYLARNWTKRANAIHFLDHTDALEEIFDQDVCLHIASLHGLLVRTFPHSLTMTTTDDFEERSVHLSLNSDDTIFLSSINKAVVEEVFHIRTVEQIIVKHIKTIQVQHDALEIVLRDSPSVRLQITAEKRELPSLHLFLTQAVEQFQVEGYDIETVHALMLCVGFNKISSSVPLTRESGAQILIGLLPTPDLAKIGIISITTASLTQLNSSELRSLHVLAHRQATLLTRITFLGELLNRLPYAATTERRTTLPCVDIWLQDLSAAIAPPHQYETAVRRIVLSLINLHSREENGKLSLVLWSILRDQTSLRALLYDNIFSYASLFLHESPQVTKISQIFRVLRAPYFVRRLSEDLVRAIDAELLSAQTDLAGSPNWNSILILVRILVDVTARSFEVTESLPELVYAILCLLNMGTPEIRALVYQLNVNIVAASACAESLSAGHRGRLLNVLDNLRDKKIQDSYMVPLHSLADASYLNDEKIQTRNQELMVAESLTAIIKLMVAALKYSATSDEQETTFLGNYCKYIMNAAFRPTVIRRRAFLALGHLSAELELPSVRPLMDALQLSLDVATSQDPRETLSIILCLSLTRVPEPFLLLKLSLALCTYPLSTIASAGLRLLLRCLVKISSENASGSLEKCLISDHESWTVLERLLGLRASADPVLFLSCSLLQSMTVTRDRSAVKLILQQLIEMRKTGGNSPAGLASTGACLILCCALSENDQELYTTYGIPVSQGDDLSSSVSRLAHWVFTTLDMKDDDLAIPTLCILMNLLANAETTEQQIKAIHFLAVAANYLPRACEFIFDDLTPFLRSVLQSSNHLPLLKAVQELIVANKMLTSKRIDRGLSNLNDKDVILREVGFDYFTRNWRLNTTTEKHKNCIGVIISSARILKRS